MSVSFLSFTLKNEISNKIYEQRHDSIKLGKRRPLKIRRANIDYRYYKSKKGKSRGKNVRDVSGWKDRTEGRNFTGVDHHLAYIVHNNR